MIAELVCQNSLGCNTFTDRISWMVVSQVFIFVALKAKGPDPRGRTRVTSDIYGVVVVVVIDEPGGGFTTTVAGAG
jgi:hypothetical protein